MSTILRTVGIDISKDWLTHLKGTRQPPDQRSERPSAAGISGRWSLHTVDGKALPKRCQQAESK